MSHVLRDDVASALSEHLSWISDDAEVISLPEFLVQIPGLIISRAHILVSEMADGLRHVMCRFQHVMGSLSRMFKIDIGLGEQLFDMRERIAVEVLRDISMPLLDLCARLRAVKTNDDLGEIATHLADKSSEIGLFTEMLKRYVTDMSKERLLSPVPEVVPPLPRNLGNPGETDG
ncbi:hypothetical protein CFI11_04905 [Thalassococcus sp. S3]|nr:hypothetical protein CFI11_04905 [Thalassococcus sp. S3]